ncbi:MAG: hypothetical protein IPM91_00015 [Bacteroidetes bacterium]|nr:hypothetical protein [Bacteroidota bacterium]
MEQQCTMFTLFNNQAPDPSSGALQENTSGQLPRFRIIDCARCDRDHLQQSFKA